MKSALFKAFIIGFLSVTLTACYGESEKKKEPEPEKEKVTLTIRNPKVEIASEFEGMVSAYEKENPGVTIKVETVGGAADDYSDITAKLAAGEGPDIFTNLGREAAKEWSRFLENLSDEPWVGRTSENVLSGITLDHKVYGMPMNIEGFGIVYNRELFARAGISSPPSTYTELEEAAAKLEEKGIMPFANGYYEDWKLGHHMASVAFAQAEKGFAQELDDGSANFGDDPAFQDLFSLIDLTVQYGNERPTSTDYYTELERFTEGEAAMILQGNWIQPLLEGKAISVGMAPVPLGNRKESRILAGVPGYWVINSQSSPVEKREAKKFLNWMVSSEKGQAYLTEKFHFIPAFKDIPVKDIGPLGEETLQLIKETDTFNWSSFSPCIKQEMGEVMQDYIDQESSRKEAMDEFDKAWKEGACLSSTS
ncbi:ABC transporter substrate-binding protein [Rossellomorea aquimaris]|jgi:raffinose/stachyose/melibiose transport system substrate-binding protein|uniref:Maltodextrin-binding protein n=1 Tax=Rossellomorea aquimaris TaxID=189382 RepID=A0A5D4U2P0_9BACI|nr:ABC transporter substrate-binding protein [Rossellomorea aquimaris]TYS81543.1 carbohydrate ABC transporter substrate-binding protein [Rossellomorea aquimaris]TYS88164.1 carbohydrate ABC transporter substrate-binding protein [Rossellomorea aquimaris]